MPSPFQLTLLCFFLSVGVALSLSTGTTARTSHSNVADSGPQILNPLVTSFSHVHLYVDHVEDLSLYKQLEDKLNRFSSLDPPLRNVEVARSFWRSMDSSAAEPVPFRSQNRDIVKQLLAGLGFRVTGFRQMQSDDSIRTNTRSMLVTSKDPDGVQFVVSAIDKDSPAEKDDLFHFDAQHIRRFYEAHSNRQGVAVLAFRVESVDAVEQRYRQLHPNLILHKQFLEDATKVLEVFAYYQGDKNDLAAADVGTVLRFIESKSEGGCILPGLSPVDAFFDENSQPAYCDHWVSNVICRTGFLKTLEDTLGFTPKADFNAGVVAAGEAQIESTVTGSDASFLTTDRQVALKNQSTVYLPINNALSEVGHVHGFLQEIGQGVQHIASRVNDLIDFVQRANDYREITGEGLTFLQIPRSYYGTLGANDLVDDEGELGVSQECANAILEVCEDCQIVSLDGAVSLHLKKEDIDRLLESRLKAGYRQEYRNRKADVLEIIMRSRYANLYKLLRDSLSEESYIGLVRNQILVDVQGEDLLYQIFSSNILQRKSGEESPFLEFIQRVCSEEKDDHGRPAQLKPGCGGFGIRNFLTLFLSIEVSKAMMQLRLAENERQREYAQEMVACFTNQLNEANPILTEISDAMTEEGRCRECVEASTDPDNKLFWQEKLDKASNAKLVGNQKLMDCSTKYKLLMRSIRERWSSTLDGP